MTCPVHAEFDPLSEAFLRDPLAGRPEAPLFYAPSLDYYVVTRYADVERVFLDPETFSAANAQLPLIALAPEGGKTLLDAGHATREFDLIEALAFPLPMRIMFSFMGVPEADWPRLKEWSGSRASLAWVAPLPTRRCTTHSRWSATAATYGSSWRPRPATAATTSPAR